MALVFEVIFSSILFTSIHKVSLSISTKTGFKPHQSKEWAAEVKVKLGRITSPFIPKHFKDKIIADAIAEALKRGTNNACYNSSLNWAVAVTLRSSDGATSGSSNTLPDSWCVDSGGASKSYAWVSGETITNSINATFCK